MFKALIAKIADEFERRRIPYMIIGGQAVLLYGEPRLTNDIDITLGLGVEEFARISAAVEALDLTVQVKDAESFVKETMVLPVQDAPSGIRVDLVFSFTPYERNAVENAVLVKWGQTTVRFASLEDLVIHKIVAGRARDIEDVRTVLMKNPTFNRDYIRKWLVEFDQALDGGCLRLFDSIVSDL
ncbi:MAG: nucleotidyl transferase AbiEii/AbiGii toxin family protein [Candidatus Aminicenantes bacterium]|nr:nucleotidyl transferase AbiEii/AbiGii toxin family protein [Candidatus Aminicenantes bacterium]